MYEYVVWVPLVQFGFCEHSYEHLYCVKFDEFHDQLMNYWLLKKDCTHSNHKYFTGLFLSSTQIKKSQRLGRSFFRNGVVF
jgi:hypothetical protein